MLYRDPERARVEIPVLAMLYVPEHVLLARAQTLAQAIGGEIVRTTSRPGGGALPLVELEGPAVALTGPAEELAAQPRAWDRPAAGGPCCSIRARSRTRSSGSSSQRSRSDERRRPAAARHRRSHRSRQDRSRRGSDRQEHHRLAAERERGISIELG